MEIIAQRDHLADTVATPEATRPVRPEARYPGKVRRVIVATPEALVRYGRSQATPQVPHESRNAALDPPSRDRADL